jgi:hypothetical protein
LNSSKGSDRLKRIANALAFSLAKEVIIHALFKKNLKKDNTEFSLKTFIEG